MKILVDNMPDIPSQCLFVEYGQTRGWYCGIGRGYTPCSDPKNCRRLKVRKGDIHVGNGSSFLDKKFHIPKKEEIELNTKCPKCGKDNINVNNVGNSFAPLCFVECSDCGFSTEYYATRKEAVCAWNELHKGLEEFNLVDITEVELKNLLPETERLCQLAEEASELAQAALKLRRVMDGTNPTPKTYEEARANLVEEVADVMCVVNLLLEDKDYDTMNGIIRMKKKRWIGRIKEARGDSDAPIR